MLGLLSSDACSIVGAEDGGGDAVVVGEMAAVAGAGGAVLGAGNAAVDVAFGCACCSRGVLVSVNANCTARVSSKLAWL